MRLRAVSTQGKFVHFGLEDGPVSINDKQTILMNVPDSPILLTKSIVRGTDDDSLFESDFVVNSIDAKLLGYVVYTDRFCLWNIKRNILFPLSKLPKVYTIENSTLHRVEEIKARGSYIQLHYDKGYFSIKRIMYAHDGNIWIDLKNKDGISMSSISFCTGVTDAFGDGIYFGQHFDGGVVELLNTDPIIRFEDNSYKLLEDVYE